MNYKRPFAVENFIMYVKNIREYTIDRNITYINCLKIDAPHFNSTRVSNAKDNVFYNR